MLDTFAKEGAVKPLIKNTLNRGHLCVIERFSSFKGIATIYLSVLKVSFIMDKAIHPNVSAI